MVQSRARPDYAQKNYDKAVEDYSQADLLTPGDADLHQNRGLAYVALNKWDDAIKDYTAAIAIAPQFPDTYIDRGSAWFRQGRRRQSDGRLCRGHRA